MMTIILFPVLYDHAEGKENPFTTGVRLFRACLVYLPVPFSLSLIVLN